MAGRFIGFVPIILDDAGATLAVARGRFPHSQPFSYYDKLLPLLPDRGKPCPYEKLLMFAALTANH